SSNGDDGSAANGGNGGNATGGAGSAAGPSGGAAPRAGSSASGAPASGGASHGGGGGATLGGGGASAGGGDSATAGRANSGSANGGSHDGGSSNGGSNNGGSSGASAGAGGGGNLLEAVTGTKNANGFALKDSFYFVPCLQIDGHDCVTVTGSCPNQSAADFEERGAVFKEDFAIGGEAGKTYKVTLRVNGITEGKYYSGGTRRDGNNYSTVNAATGSDGWHVGGAPVASTYNVFKLVVLKPGGTEELQHYYLNSYPTASGLESHQTVLLGYEATIDVPAGGVVRYVRVDSNCKAINNCGPGDNGNTCPSPRKLPNEPDLALPSMYGGKSLASLNVVNGAVQPYHSQLVHVTVTKVEASP
ncbi:MAG TPA: hypothetical protein VEQ59_07865, partial [Polyangiaceae bacterium]|nr:hypothetical protein [Polyangiaceae bacterium]